MEIIDHGTFSPYQPVDHPLILAGHSIAFCRNEAGIDWYELHPTIEPDAALVELDTVTGVIYGLNSAVEPAYDTRWPNNRRLLEVRPAEEAYALTPGMIWDGEHGFDPVPPPVFTRLSKADLWRRLTDVEAELLDQAMDAAPVRLRRIFEAAAYLDINDPDYPELRTRIVAALGETRANEILEPNLVF